jgi:ABC-type lipoprotein export system ATPase subunit
MLRLEAVSKRFTRRGSPVVALHPTTLEIPSGDHVAVVGPSGSGKTTLLSVRPGSLPSPPLAPPLRGLRP